MFVSASNSGSHRWNRRLHWFDTCEAIAPSGALRRSLICRPGILDIQRHAASWIPAGWLQLCRRFPGGTIYSRTASSYSKSGRIVLDHWYWQGRVPMAHEVIKRRDHCVSRMNRYGSCKGMLKTSCLGESLSWLLIWNLWENRKDGDGLPNSPTAWDKRRSRQAILKYSDLVEAGTALNLVLRSPAINTSQFGRYCTTTYYNNTILNNGHTRYCTVQFFFCPVNFGWSSMVLTAAKEPWWSKGLFTLRLYSSALFIEIHRTV